MPLITITYRFGCEGPAIGELAAAGLNLKLYDDARLANMAREIGISNPDLINLAQKPPGILNQILDRKSSAYLDAMETVIHRIAEKGEGVIVGHASQFLLQDFGCAFHVKLQSKPSTRVQWIMDRQRLDRATARTLVRNADEQQKSFLQYAFNIDVDNPNAYDLVINMEKIGPQGAAQIIIDSTAIENLGECSLDAYQAMERLVLEKKVRAAIVENHIDLSTLHIAAEDAESVNISGIASSEADKKRLPDILADMPEVRTFDIDVSVWSRVAIG